MAGKKMAKPSPNDTAAPASATPRGPTVVAIGASAGGLAALETLFTHTPGDTGLAYVVVVHLSPEHRSHLAELLQTHAKMPVAQVTETVELEPNRVYVIPPGANLEAIDTHLRLAELQQSRRDRAPIDHFLRTLSRTHDGDAIGVILSGTGSDGTLGLREIKEKGGLTIAQDPAEAEYDGMPQSAIATGSVDLVLPLDAIPAAVLRYLGTEPAVPMPADGDEISGEARRVLTKIFALLQGRTGRDFSRYEPSTVLRRIARRMQLASITELGAYLERLRSKPDEAAVLADDLLITVTSFFRDPEVFGALAERVVPMLFDRRPPEGEVRVWSVGCATGEEAYSIAMLLIEAVSGLDDPPRIQIFASDLHEHSLTRAREGFYPGDIEADVSPARLRRFFHKESGGYRIRKEVRDLVVFAPHNLLTDPPFSRLDLISCRNLLIYLQRDVQQDVIELFHYALKPEGALLLGSAERVDSSDLFRVEDKKLSLYRKRDAVPSEPRIPAFPILRPRAGSSMAVGVPGPTSYGTLHQRMVERYALPSLLVSPADEVVHRSTHAGRYLVQPGDAVTTNVVRLVREELRLELRAAIQNVRTSSEPHRTRPIEVRFNGDVSHVVLDVRPTADGEEEGFILVVFDERLEVAGFAGAPPRAEEAEVHEELDDRARAERLETERNEAYGRLQAIVEEYETGQEEMRATNEELQTVNQENPHKVEELAHLSSDPQNLLAATDIATLFLDRDLRILRFTPKVSELFNVRTTDRGRPLSDITHRLADGELLGTARRVLETLIPVERETMDEEGRWYLVRVLPYRTLDDRIMGVVITLVDITSRKDAEEELRESKAYAERITETLHEPLLVLEPDLRVRSANRAFYAHFDTDPMETLGRGVYELGEGQWDIPALRKLLEEVLPRDEHFDDFEVEHEFRRIGARTMLLNGRRLRDEDLILLGIRDITERKRDERALRDTQARLAQELRASRRLHEMMVRTFLVTDLDSMLEEVLDAAIDLQGADFGSLQLLREDGMLEIVAQRGLSEPFLDAFRQVSAADYSVCGRALAARRPVLIADVLEDEQLRSFHDVYREAGVRGVQSVPLVSRDDEVLGMISTHFRAPHPGSDRDDQIMAVVAQQAADVIGRLRADELLRHFAETLEERVEERTREVRELSSTLTMAEQEERRRVSQVLHDDLQQLLYGIQMRLQLAREEADAGDTGALLRQADRSLELLDEAVTRTRRLTVDLSPPVLQGEGFVEAVQWMQTQMRELHGLEVDVRGDHHLDVRPRELRILLFHVVREFLFNVAKHAHTHSAAVDIALENGMLRILVEDQGRGFDLDSVEDPGHRLTGGFGIFSARERVRMHGGDVRIESSSGEGTRVEIYAPISSSS